MAMTAGDLATMTQQPPTAFQAKRKTCSQPQKVDDGVTVTAKQHRSHGQREPNNVQLEPNNG
jgi:hypothetical protein